MARPARPVRRVELRIPIGEMLDGYEAEAQLRGVELQQHLYDLLRALYLARQGTDMGSLLRVPGAATVGQEVAVPEPEPAPPAAAALAAEAWLDMME